MIMPIILHCDNCGVELSFLRKFIFGRPCCGNQQCAKKLELEHLLANKENDESKEDNGKEEAGEGGNTL